MSTISVFRFEDEAAYEAAKAALIEIHERNPPPPSRPILAIATREYDSGEFAAALDNLGIPYKRKDESIRDDL